ncbi:hypothetical protein DPMN_181724 [Dreissena polymorpha]|uniref:SRCR domain-containing protein n=1 Tax=Dreissena polymorpha TaxID=45954 RepID=A0A9D4DDE5_DREPO|nr:hypothetical protein DPMN_181724 [Dreissena polymorpha]
MIADPPLNITDVRLVDGPDPNEGRVEIAVGGVFGTIFTDLYTSLVQDMAMALDLYTLINFIVMELKLPLTNVYTFKTDNAVTAEMCTPVQVQDIRLVNQEVYPYRGTVELKINDTWGTICGNMFGVEEATVLCRMMNAR